MRSGFSTLRECAYTIVQDQPVQNYRDTVRDVSRIKQMLFGGFTHCLYPLQKFDSDTERRFAVILERKDEKCEKWCSHASEYLAQHGGKPWKYLLIPHDAVKEANSLAYFAQQFAKAE